MKTAQQIRWFTRRSARVAMLGLMFLAGLTSLRADIQLDVLNTRTGTFTNVTVYNLTKTDVFFRHARGMTNLKVRDLDETGLRQLGLLTTPAPTAKSSATAEAKSESATPSATSTAAAGSTEPLSKLDISKQQFAKLKEQLEAKLKPALANLSAKFPETSSPTFLGIAAALVFAIYLFWCWCFSLICMKTGNEPGFLIWLPILQIFPLLRAAGMSAWWFLAGLIPVLNVIAPIVWCFKIAKARGKSAWVGFFLLLPVISGFAFLYLVFSSGVVSVEERRPVRVGRAAAALAEA